MRVVLPVPADWPIERTADGWSYRVVGRDGTRVVASQLRQVPPLFTTEWAERRLARTVPAGHRLVICEAHERTGARGWTLVLGRYVVEAPGGEVVEHRIVAAYHFLYFFGTAELRADRSVEIDDELVAVLLAASPDVTGEPACLAHLYEG
jgi:hypothetical protein